MMKLLHHDRKKDKNILSAEGKAHFKTPTTSLYNVAFELHILLR